MSGSSLYKCGICDKEFIKPSITKSSVEFGIAKHLGLTHGLLRELVANHPRIAISSIQPPKKQSTSESNVTVLDEDSGTDEQELMDLSKTDLQEDNADLSSESDQEIDNGWTWSNIADLTLYLTEE